MVLARNCSNQVIFVVYLATAQFSIGARYLSNSSLSFDFIPRKHHRPVDTYGISLATIILLKSTYLPIYLYSFLTSNITPSNYP